MKITLEIGEPASVERKIKVRIAHSEFAAAYLHMAFPEKRNRTEFYKQRHLCKVKNQNCIQSVISTTDEPPKMPISAHIREMRSKGIIPSYITPTHKGSEEFGSETSMIAVPISDLVANLLRPCYHILELGKYKLFYFDAEPINLKNYWCVCFFHNSSNEPILDLRYVHFDPERDQAVDPLNKNSIMDGLVWAAALVPLVVNGKSLSPVEIAQNNYDLRQIIGRQAFEAMRFAYQGWFEEWNERVEKVVLEHQKNGKNFESFYHSILGMDKSKNIYIYQMEGTLPQLAKMLVDDGIIAAGLLDSGGSCAIYDVWMESYLNHSWYFREPRGSIIVFELTSKQRIPKNTSASWFNLRRKG